MIRFGITILDKPRKDNVVIDFLSRLTVDDDCMSVEDSFPYEYIFAISAYSLRYADIANYLVAQRFTQHLSSRERKRIVQQSAIYSWVEGYLYYIGSDQ